jgi:hypothetical protein
MSSERPCSVSRKNPTGTSARAGQRIRPPALLDISSLTHAFMKIGQDSFKITIAIGSRKKSVPKISTHARVRDEKREEMTSIRMCSLCSRV